SLRIFHLVLFGQTRIAMAGGASTRQVELKHGRIGVLCGQHVVRPVTTPATGRTGRAEGMANAMDTGGIIFGSLFMGGLGVVAADTIGRRQLAGMDQILNASVTIYTVKFGMN